MKYLIVRRGTTEDALFLGPCLGHKEIADSLGPEYKVIGAGICSFCWSPEECGWKVDLRGGSSTLNMGCKEEDKFYIRFALNNS